jgi:tape measure domain-containing protein
MATEVGNIHIGLYVDVGESRRFTDVANIVERDSRRMNTALGNTTRSVGALRSSLNQSLRLRLASDSLRNLSKATGEMERLRAAMLGVAAITGTGVTGAFTGAYLVQTADKARLLGNQIRTVTEDTADFANIQDRLFSVSQRTRTSLESTVQIYARTARATETLGTSQEKVLRLTETVQKAFAIGGATPQEATGAAIQLSQGIASDRFGGEEFRSVAENAPVLLKGIADALGVNIGKLREMSHEGLLTAQVVTEAIIKSSDQIDAAFAKMIPTVAQSFTVLDNTFLRYIGESDEAYGFTKKLSSAIIALSENFEDVMFWVTRVTAGLAAFYAARKLTMKGQTIVGGVQATNMGIRQEIEDRFEANKAIDKRLVEIRAEQAAALAAVGDAENAAVLKQSDQINAAREKEYLAQQHLRELESQRAEAGDKFKVQQNATIAGLQKEVEVARQRVRDDQLRVVQAQEAAAAEERILRARMAQRLTKADQVQSAAQGKVEVANQRVLDAAAAIQKERELAKVRLANEIDARRQSLVTNQLRLSQIQEQIADLRSIKDLPDFDKAYGSQYKRLLADQARVISGSAALRDEIDSLGEKIAEVDRGATKTRGISAAMSKHAAAVKQAEAAVKALKQAEEARNKIATAEVGGKTLEARLAAEANEIDRYQKSIDSLQARMGDLREATNAAFAGPAGKKMIADIDALDRKIAAAQANLKTASDAVASAQNGNLSMLGTSLEAQSRAAKTVNDLQAEANALIERQTVNTARLEAAQKRLNIVRRAGSNILGFFGGWTGLAITGALVAASALMAKFAAEAAESAEQTERITKQLEDMGYLTKQAASAMEEFQDDVAAGHVSKLQEEVKNFQAEMSKVLDELKNMDVGGAAAKQMIDPLVIPEGTSSFEANRLQQEWLEASKKGLEPVRNKLAEIRDEMIKSKGMSDQMRRSLEDMALAQPDLSSITYSLIKMGEVMNALRKASADWLENIKQIRTQADWPQQFRASETESMDKLDKLNESTNVMLSKEVKEAGWSDLESRIHSIMDKLIKDAEKLGLVLTQSRARETAEAVVASETAKKGLRDLIGLFEGTDKGRGYNETLGYGKFTGGDVNLTNMTLREILDLQKQMLAHPDNTFNSSAVGRYQITSQTLRDFMGRMNLNMDDVFSPEMQDRIADEIIRSTGGDVSKLRGRWEGLLRASDEQIRGAAGETFKNLPRLDESAQQWLDGMKDLDLKAQVQALSEFDQEVIQTAQSMGVSRDQVDKYIAALRSGDLKNAPEIFGQIAAKLKQGVDTGFGRKLQEFKDANVISLLSDVDQKVIETARSFGIGEAAIKAYVEALQNGELEKIPPQFAAIRAEIEKMSLITMGKDLVNGALTDIRSALEDGKITWKEWGDIAVNMINKVLDKLQTQLVDSLFSGGFNLFGLLGGGFPAAPKPGLFDEGGYTGPGGKYDPAGIVHAGEFVFDAEATRRAGVRNLMNLMEMLRTGQRPTQLSLPGYDRGGFVSHMNLPRFDRGGFAERLHGMDQLREAAAQRPGMDVSLGLTVDDEGGLGAFVKKAVVRELIAKGPAIMGKIHNDYRRNQMKDDVRKTVQRPRVKGTY